MKSRSIAIVGQGAIGSLFAYYYQSLSPVLLLKNTRQEAKTIVDINNNETLLSFSMLNINSPLVDLSLDEDKDKPPADITTSKAPTFDAIIIAVKGYQLAKLITQIKPWLSTATRLILIQNGMGGAHLLAKAFPQNLIYIGTTTDAVFAKSTSHYQITALGRLDIGPAWNMLAQNEYAPKALTSVDSQKFTFENAQILNQHIVEEEKKWISNFIKFHPNAMYHRNVTQALYTKLAINAVINPLTAVLQVKNGQLFEFPEKMNDLKNEVFAVYAAIGLNHSPAALSQAIDLVIEATAENYSSMCQDVKYKRLTENESLLGYLLSTVKKKSVSTPLMTSLYKQLADIDAALS